MCLSKQALECEKQITRMLNNEDDMDEEVVPEQYGWDTVQTAAALSRDLFFYIITLRSKCLLFESIPTTLKYKVLLFESISPAPKTCFSA